MPILGAIREINDFGLVLDLPNQLVGRVALTEISDPITELIQKASESDDKDVISFFFSLFFKKSLPSIVILQLQLFRILNFQIYVITFQLVNLFKLV